MLEMPGRKDSGNLKNDFDNLVRWAQRLVPQLEQQMANLGVDNFTTAYNERLEGLTTLTGAVGSKTTAEAVAEHLLDYKNPHKVTLAQLGYQVPQAQVEEKSGSLLITLGGLMIQIKPVEIEAGTATAEGNVFKRTESAGDWEQEFSALYCAMAVINTGDMWLGSSTDQDETSAGTLTIYTAAAAAGAGTATMIGIGRV